MTQHTRIWAGIAGEFVPGRLFFRPTGAGCSRGRSKREDGSRGAGVFHRFPQADCEYPLTRICLLEYINSMQTVFEIIAEPNRRAILSLLVSSQQSVGEIERQLRMSQPTVSKHLRVLREAGFVESTVDAQRRVYQLKPGPLQELDAWLAQFRHFWSAHVDALERHLDRMHPPTSKKKNKENATRPKPRMTKEK